jgi:predicted enzyme related to lactoylglutathione lyase
MKMNPVVHFEMPYKDAKRVSRFYEKAFGWDMQHMPQMGKYVLAITTPMTKDNMHKKKGAINGGFYPKGKDAKTVHLVISVDDIKKHMAAIKKAGGKVLGKPMDIPGVGKFVMIKDTEGNSIGVLQPTQM